MAEEFVPTAEQVEKVKPIMGIFGPKINAMPEDVQAQFRADRTDEQKSFMDESFKEHADADTGIISLEKFIVWQNMMGDKQKEWFNGHGMVHTDDESKIIYEGMASLSPEYEGVKHEDMWKLRKSFAHIKAQMAAAQ